MHYTLEKQNTNPLIKCSVNRAGAFFISCIVLNFITVPAGFLSIYSLDLYIKQQKINYRKRNPNRNFALRGFSQLTRHEWCCLQRKWKGKKELQRIF